MNKHMNVAGVVITCGLLAGCTMQERAMPSARPAPPPSWSLVEHFGVSHPDQIVYLDLPAGFHTGKVANAVLMDATSNPVPFQLMGNGQLAVRTDLPAGASRGFSLQPGQPASCPEPVVITPARDYFELTNGLIGLRVPITATDLSGTPSPIQGLRFRDGIWTAVGSNTMDRPAKAMTVEWLEKGPLVARVKIAYVYDKGPLHSARPELPDVPAGEGPYSVTIEMQAGQPSILFEEECEVDIGYRVNITDGLTPDRARYRGHHATSPEAGHEEDGRVYRYETFGNQRHDALVDLDYARDPKTKGRWSGTTYPFMSHWDPWGVDTGYYWQLYSTAPGGSDNLFGIFAGRASRLINPGLTGVSFDTRTVNGLKTVDLQVRFQRLMPTQYYTTHMRFNWGIFLGSKSVDLKPVRDVQGVNRQMNLHAGVNLNTLYRLPGDFPDPKAGYGTLYAPVTAWKGVADALRAEKVKGGKTFYSQQYSANPYLGTLLEYWADPTPESAKKAADAVNSFAQAYLETQVNGEGIYQHSTHYFMGASSMSGNIIWIDQLLASDQLAPEEKAKLKRAAALFATALWDNDVTPMQPDCGMNWGPANMSSMWRGTRNTYTLFLADHPAFSKEVESVRKEALGLLHDYTCESGACTAGSHYTGASMVPILNLLQQMQMRGVTDAFATEKRLTDYAEWEMQLTTPPEIRFGGLRKIIAIGDGSTEQNVRIGQIGTGFAKSNAALSARLMGVWQAMGRPQDNFFGASLLKIDSSLPAASPQLGDARFDGWMSVLRAGWETPDESAVFFINGDVLSDHRHNDQGEVILYALGAPLSLDFGSMYAPRSSGGLMHSIALPESWLGRAWDADNVPLDVPAGPGGRSSWWNTQAGPFASFSESSWSGARFSSSDSRTDARWQRTVRFLHPDPAHPIIVIDDVFTGKALTNKPVVSTFNMMAQGAVATPTGSVTPLERLHTPDQNTTPDKLPSTSPVSPLAAGLNKFGFTGQWIIDWDVYTEAAVPMQAFIGNWGHKWHPSGEQNQFVKAQGRPFEERQHILRLRGQDTMRMIILPFRKGERPDNLTVTKQNADTVIQSGSLTLTLTANGFFCENGERKNLTSFGAEPVEAFGITLKGGPSEVWMASTNGTLQISGGEGDRTIKLPEGWSLRTPHSAANASVRKSEQSYEIDVTRPGAATWSLDRK
jgi:hypothetical protein